MFGAAGIAVAMSGVLVCATLFSREPACYGTGKVAVGQYGLKSAYAGRVLQYMVKDGDFIGAGDTVAVIDAFEIMRDEATSRFNADTTEVTADKVSKAYQVLERTRQGMYFAKRAYERMKNLYDEGVVSDEKHDEALINFKTMEGQVIAAQRNYDALCAVLQRRSGMQFDPQHDMKGAATMLLNEKFLVSEVEGEVDALHAELGDIFPIGSKVATISVISDAWGEFEVSRAAMQYLKCDTRFVVYVPAFGKEAEMVVSEIKTVEEERAGSHESRYIVTARFAARFEGLRPDMQLVIRRFL